MHIDGYSLMKLRYSRCITWIMSRKPVLFGVMAGLWTPNYFRIWFSASSLEIMAALINKHAEQWTVIFLMFLKHPSNHLHCQTFEVAVLSSITYRGCFTSSTYTLLFLQYHIFIAIKYKSKNTYNFLKCLFLSDPPFI